MQKKITMDLHPKEAELILAIRNKYQFGEITVECYQGLPHRIGKTTVYEKFEEKKFSTEGK